MSLKVKIIVFIVILLFSVAVVASIVNYRISVNATEEQLKDVSLPLSVGHIYGEVQQHIIEPLIVSSVMAHDAFVKDWILEGEKDTAQIQKYLTIIQERYGAFTSFLVSDKTKHYYHPRGMIDTIEQDNSEDDWFFAFKQKPDSHEVNLDTNKLLSHDLIVFVNYKVKDYTDKFLAVVGIGMKFFNIEEMLYAFKKKYDYDVYFVSETGEITLFNRTLNKRGNIATVEGLKEYSSDILAKKVTQLEYKESQNKYLLIIKYIDVLKLYLFVEINKKAYMEELNKTFLMNLLLSLLTTLIMEFMIIYVINIYQKKLEKQAQEDTLTRLANRRKFNEEFAQLYELYHRRAIKRLGLLLIDIDDFKSVNDSFGHLMGDKVLVRIAEVMKQQLRKTDIIARWGGEEFSVLLVDTTQEEAMKIANTLSLSIKEDKQLYTLLEKKITVSIGLANLSSGESQDGLIAKVDAALYHAKNSGKDRVSVA